MASVIEPPQTSQQYVDFDEYVDLQLQKARDGIRATDILTAVMMFGVGLMVWLLLFVILDHWVIQDGVGTTARIAMAVGFGIVSLAWLGWKVLVPYLHRVNRLFAAKQIERTQPELQSTLLNLVDLQDDGREVPPEIQQSLQRRAAESMAHTDVDTAIDRRPLMISVYAFCVLIVVFLLYSLFTPKRVSSSVWRAILPTADIAAPTETVIESVEPGDAEVVPGTRLSIEVEISGETPEAVELVYTTSDRAFVDEVVPLRTDETTPGRYVGDILGVNGAGIQQSLTYRIYAGDTRSPEYTVSVHQPPTAQVTEVRLSHPDYMKLPTETQTSGNIDDYEGTTVSIQISANMPLKSAVVTFSDDNGTDFGAENIPLRAVDEDRRQFRGRWMLTIASDGVYPTHYQIDVRNEQDERDPSPTRYDIAIRPDERPEIRVVSPREPKLERPANAILPLRFAARDDFAVQTATLWKQKNEEQPRVHRVLFEGFEKALTAGYEWKIGEGPGWVVKPGDRITWWIEARDNNTLRPGRKNSEKRVVVISEPVTEDEVQKQLEQDRKQEENDPQNDSEESQDQNENADRQPSEQQDSKLTDKDPPKPEENVDQNQDENDQSSEEKNSDGKSGESGEASEGGEGGEQQDESVANDGSEDGEALKELVERFREQEEQKNKDGSGDSDPQNPDGNSDPNNSEPQPNESDQEPSGDMDQPSDSDTSDANDNKQPSDSDPKSDEPSNEKQPTNEDSKKPNENKQPNSENQPGEPSDSAENDPKPTSDNSDGSKKPNSSNKSSGNNSAPGGENAESPDDPANMSDGDGGTSTKPASENKKPGDVTGGERTPDDGTSKPTDTADQPIDGKSTDSEKKPDDSTAEEKPASDAMGDGTGEKRSTDQKPNSDTEPKPSDSDQKPGENSRKTDRDPDNRKGNPDSKPSDTDPANGQPSDKQDSMDKADRPEDGMTDDSRRPAKRDGDTDGGEDELKGDAPPNDQKSERPEGGEKGGSKQNQEGQPGSKETGPGDESDTPGNKETSEKPNGGEASDETGKGSSKRPADDKQPADGMGEPSTSDDKSADPNGQKPSTGEPGTEADPKQPMNDGSEENTASDPKSGDPKKPSDTSSDPKPGNTPGGSDQPNGEKPNESRDPKPNQDPNGQRTGNGGPQGPDGNEGKEAANNANQEVAPADQPNLEDSEQAADFVLKKLEDDLKRGQVDEDWLKKMGWTDKDAARFLDRMKERQNPVEDTARSQAQRRQYEEWLKQLQPKSQTKTVRRQGSSVRNRADRDVISAPPPDAPAAVRNLYEEYLRGIAERRDRLND